MTILAVNSATTGQSSWAALPAPAAGSNRLHIYFIGAEVNGGTTESLAETLTLDGKPFTKIGECEVTATYARGITAFAALESTLDASGNDAGLIVLDGSGNNCQYSGAHMVGSITLGDIDQGIDLNTIAVLAPDVTSINVPTNDGEDIVVCGLASNPGAMTWAGATEQAEWGSTFDMAIATHASIETENRTISYSTDAASNFDPSVIGLSVPAVQVVPGITSINGGEAVYRGQTGVVVNFENMPGNAQVTDMNASGENFTNVSHVAGAASATIDVPVNMTTSTSTDVTANFTE